MNFEEALKLLKQGKKVRLSTWVDYSQYISFDTNYDLTLFSEERGEVQSKDFRLDYLYLTSDNWEEYKGDDWCIKNYIFDRRGQKCVKLRHLKKLKNLLIKELTHKVSMARCHDVIKTIEKRFKI